jgi:hypothetical protein
MDGLDWIKKIVFVLVMFVALYFICLAALTAGARSQNVCKDKHGLKYLICVVYEFKADDFVYMED